MASIPVSLGVLIPISPAPLQPIYARFNEAELQSISVGELREQFLFSKSVKCNAGDMVPWVLKRYAMVCQRIKAMFGEMTAVENLKAMHFTRLRASLPSTWGPAVVGTFIQNTRTLFKFAYDSELIDRPMRFGPDFCKPSLRSYRKARRLKGLQMFEAEEIRTMLDTLHSVLRRPWYPWSLRAMILLGVNCGFGNADCGRLPFAALDLKGGWVTFPRPKTEADRRCPLWPETREAIERSLLERPEPRNPADADMVFLTKYGFPWSDGGPSPALTKRLKWLMIRANVRRLWRGFYGLRRTFRTIADEASDSPATNLIMGHCAKSNDMGALYTQRISDERLQAVVAKVRAWLWPGGEPLDWDDPNHCKAAAKLFAEWDVQDRLTSTDIQGALKLLGITNRELARGTGLDEQWLSIVALGKRPLSSDTELKIRVYVQQLSEQKTPAPLTKEQLRRGCNNPSEVQLSDAAIEALKAHPLTGDSLAVLADCLAAMGIPQTTLAQWWNHKYKFYQDMRYGRKSVPHGSANRLRAFFGLPRIENPKTVAGRRRPIMAAAAHAIAGIFNGEKFGATELDSVLCHLSRGFGVKRYVVAGYLRISTGTLPKMVKGKRPVDVRVAMQNFCAAIAKGGAE